MRTRYPTNIALAGLGGFLVVVSMAFSVSTFMWLMLAVGIATLAISAAAGALPGRGIYQRAIDGPLGVLGAWTIIASMVFAGATVTWLGFAAGCAIVALAVIGLTLHELRTERVIHTLEFTGVLEQDGPALTTNSREATHSAA